jgi:hypothetical protein
MIKGFKKILSFVIGVLISITSIAQSTFSLEAMTVGLHPFDRPNLQVYENAIDIDGLFCAEPGLILSYESFVHENLASFQLSQAFFADAAGQLAGFTEISFRRVLFHKWGSTIYIGTGPTLTYRKSWELLDRYVPEGGYTTYGTWQLKPWFIFKVEYDLYIGKKSDIMLGVIYGHEYNTITATLGYRHWISTKVKRTRKCNCGADKYKKKFKDWFW